MNKLFSKFAPAAFIAGISSVALWQFSGPAAGRVLKAAPAATPPVVVVKVPPNKKPLLVERKPLLEMKALKIKGVGLYASEATVLRKLGKPLRSKRGGKFQYPCGGDLLAMRYNGLIIQLDKTENDRSFRVASMDVTSSKWQIAGVTIGADLKSIEAKFDRYIYQKETEKLVFANGDGFVNFYFKNKKLVRIHWEANYC